MKVLALNFSFDNAYRYLHIEEAVRKITYSVLICPYTATGKASLWLSVKASFKKLSSFSLKQSSSLVLYLLQMSIVGGLARCFDCFLSLPFLTEDNARDAMRKIAEGKFIFSPYNLNDSRTVVKIERSQPDVGLFNGGVICKGQVLKVFKRGVLNYHIGMLPKFRGRSVVEWSLILGGRPYATVFFMDEGIDTGKEIVFSKYIDITGDRSFMAGKSKMFQQDLLFYKIALASLQNSSYHPLNQELNGGERFFQISELLREYVEMQLFPKLAEKNTEREVNGHRLSLSSCRFERLP